VVNNEQRHRIPENIVVSGAQKLGTEKGRKPTFTQ
jgi:hypothetical protein